jgi:predicted esterase
MDFLTFDELRTRLQGLYAAGDAEVALDLLSVQTPNFPEYQPLLVYWQSVLEAQLGNPSNSLRLLNAMLDHGTWYSEVLLSKNPVFQALLDDPDFLALLGRNQALHQADPTSTIPLLAVRPANRCRPGGPTCPLLLALHANYTSAHIALPYWQPAATMGWMVAALQSTQFLWRGAAVWDDLQAAREQAQRNFNTLQSQYALDPERLLLAGNGQGAETAAWLALSGSLPAHGLILIGQNGPLTNNPEGWAGLLADYGGPDLRAYLILGEEDDSADSDLLQRFAEMLREAGFPTEFEIVPQLGADDAEGYDSAVQRALEFLDVI